MRTLPFKRIKGAPYRKYIYHRGRWDIKGLRNINRAGVTVGNRKNLHNSMARYTAHRRTMQNRRFNRNEFFTRGMLGLNRLARIPTDVLRNIGSFL